MKLYVDTSGDRHYLVTDDGESVYVEELQEEGRDTEYLEQAIDAARRHPAVAGSVAAVRSPDVEPFIAD